MIRHTVVVAALAATMVRPVSPGQAQAVSTLSTPTARTPVPFAIGERAEYDVKFGFVRAGTARMELLGVESLRGRDAYHFKFRVTGGIPLYRVDDVLESWVDTVRFHSLRFVQDQEEGGRTRERSYEIFPDRSAFQERGKAEVPSVPDPLDDASFLYFIRSLPLEVGRTYEFNRYFKPGSNPVKIIVLRRERIEVPAGTFNTIVIQPIIKTRGIFSEGGRAEVWLAEDASRVVVQMKSRLPFGSLNLYLKSYRAGGR